MPRNKEPLLLMQFCPIQKLLTCFPLGQKAVPGLGLPAEAGECCREGSGALKWNHGLHPQPEGNKKESPYGREMCFLT